VAPIWRKAEAYGFPGVQVDGNDVLAVYLATKDAAARAREDGVPTLIEAVTYRMGPQSTADDVSKYRRAADVEPWKTLDPIDRYRRWIEAAGIGDEAFFGRVEEEAKAFGGRMRAGVIDSAPPPPEELFEWIFAGDLPEHLARQREEMLRFARGDEGSEGGRG
jgi:2-oxoisovalerate dehydrogenase E1 component alpha subunit